MEETRADRRYVFFDIDGTLAVGTSGTQYIPDSAVEAIKGLRKACHFTAIATGRATPWQRTTAGALALQTW